MSNQYHTQVTIILDANNGNLDNYPKTSRYEFSFDATDLNIFGYVEQFRCVLRAAGFSEKNITEAIGDF